MGKFREHRGGLAESMHTVKWIRDRKDLLFVVKELLRPWGIEVTNEDLEVKPYGFDSRIGWDTHMVTLKSRKDAGVIGFTDGLYEDEKGVLDEGDFISSSG